MKIRAVLFDIYNTLLQVSPRPTDATERWAALWQNRLAAKPRLSIEQFARTCATTIACDHAQARAAGVVYPEVLWPEIVRAVLPETAALTPSEFENFIYEQCCLCHTVHLVPDAATLLFHLKKEHVLLGLVSNCQAYTLRELEVEFSRFQMTLDLFARELCFFSFEHGYSKPDPHVFRAIDVRLRARGMLPHEILMVGDRPDNDIEPAQKLGWQTWQISSTSPNFQSGTWLELADQLFNTSLRQLASHSSSR